MTISLATITAADFEPRIGETFRLSLPNGAVDLRLATIKRAGQSGREGGSFSLTFVGPRDPHLPQAIYPIANEHTGDLQIFIVPIGPVEGGNGYEAVFG